MTWSSWHGEAGVAAHGLGVALSLYALLSVKTTKCVTAWQGT
jgi:hypothetical protein